MFRIFYIPHVLRRDSDSATAHGSLFSLVVFRSSMVFVSCPTVHPNELVFEDFFSKFPFASALDFFVLTRAAFVSFMFLHRFVHVAPKKEIPGELTSAFFRFFETLPRSSNLQPSSVAHHDI